VRKDNLLIVTVKYIFGTSDFKNTHLLMLVVWTDQRVVKTEHLEVASYVHAFNEFIENT
jgi:hypothetical protein